MSYLSLKNHIYIIKIKFFIHEKRRRDSFYYCLDIFAQLLF
jgi:hypothetical protein